MDNKKLRDFSVILVEPKKQGNIGLIARLCNNFGVKELILVGINDQRHLSLESRKFAMHSQHYLNSAKIVDSLSNARDKFQILIGTSARASKSFSIIRQPSYPWELQHLIKSSKGNIGIVFGREDRGLTNEELAQCDFLVNIPLPGDHKVLNITHAVSIILYEFWRILNKVEEEIEKQEISSFKQRQVLFSLFEKIVTHIPYLEYKKPSVIQSFNKIVNRSFPTPNEIDCLIGFFRRMFKHCVSKNASEGH